jgi:hypothetical protein
VLGNLKDTDALHHVRHALSILSNARQLVACSIVTPGAIRCDQNRGRAMARNDLGFSRSVAVSHSRQRAAEDGLPRTKASGILIRKIAI